MNCWTKDEPSKARSETSPIISQQMANFILPHGKKISQLHQLTLSDIKRATTTPAEF